jgi:membrane protein
MFPAFIALISLIGLFGQGQTTVKTLLDVLRQIGAGSAATTLEPTLTSLASQPQAAGIAFVVGLATALWSASGYVGAFSRAMNRMYEVGEGRPVWKLRPVQLLVTLVELLLVAAVLLALVLTGTAASAVGNAIGIGSTAITVWNIVKWPVMLLVVVLVIAILYWATPNIKQPKFRWLSIGALVAIVVLVLATALFGFYVAHFSSYNKTYGSLAGVVVFLLWLWITNLVLLFGAELDAEIERGRELQAGITAEETVQLPPRDDRNLKKQEKQQQKDIEKGRALRESRGETQEDAP